MTSNGSAMRVFVTGATGFICQAVTQELLRAGHQVLGLSRSDSGAATLKTLGAEVLRGTLTDVDVLKQGAATCDAVIHLAFIHDFSDYAGACATDRTAISAMGSALEGTDRALVTTSGTLMLPAGRLVTEDDPPDAVNPVAAMRGASEAVTLGFAAKGVRACVVRLPPTNHGDGDHGFLDMVAKTAKVKGVSAYIGDGANRWPAVHRLDTAAVYRLAAEKGRAGSVLHAVADEGVPTREIAEAIGKNMNVPVVSRTSEEARDHFGFVGVPFAVDNPASGAKTKEQLGWNPAHPSLLMDIESGVYAQE